MQRQNIMISLNIQFPNPIQPPQWEAPVLITQASVVVGEDGNAVYQPAFTQVPAAKSDITDDVLAQMQVLMAALGLSVSRLEAPAATPVSE